LERVTSGTIARRACFVNMGDDDEGEGGEGGEEG
jgi:hypothetical protein